LAPRVNAAPNVTGCEKLCAVLITMPLQVNQLVYFRSAYREPRGLSIGRFSRRIVTRGGLNAMRNRLSIGLI
jgi:hypothetical protein